MSENENSEIKKKSNKKFEKRKKKVTSKRNRDDENEVDDDSSNDHGLTTEEDQGNDLVAQVMDQMRSTEISESSSISLEIEDNKEEEASATAKEIVPNARSILSLSDAPKLDSFEPSAIRKFWEERLRYEYNSKSANVRMNTDLKPTISSNIQKVFAVSVFNKDSVG